MAILYRQKLWDSGTAGWVFYEKNTIDPAPIASETSPNYTGVISSHSIISTRDDGTVPSTTLVKWNGIDTSQFQVSFDAVGGGTAALSVVQQSWGPVLRLTFPTKITGELQTFVTWVDPGIVPTSNLYTYTSKFRIVGVSAAEFYAVGPAFLCNKLTGANFYGLGMGTHAGTAARFGRVQGGVSATSGGTPQWTNNIATTGNSGFNIAFRSSVVAKHAGAAPGFMNSLYARRLGDTTNPPYVDGCSNTIFASSVGAFGAGWNTETLDTCGLYFLSKNGTTAGQYYDFDCLEVVNGVDP